jgi:hypothetical protein
VTVGFSEKLVWTNDCARRHSPKHQHRCFHHLTAETTHDSRCLPDTSDVIVYRIRTALTTPWRHTDKQDRNWRMKCAAFETFNGIVRSVKWTSYGLEDGGSIPAWSRRLSSLHPNQCFDLPTLQYSDRFYSYDWARATWHSTSRQSHYSCGPQNLVSVGHIIFASTQLLRNWHEQRPTSKNIPDLSVTLKIRTMHYKGEPASDFIFVSQ